MERHDESSESEQPERAETATRGRTRAPRATRAAAAAAPAPELEEETWLPAQRRASGEPVTEPVEIREPSELDAPLDQVLARSEDLTGPVTYGRPAGLTGERPAEAPARPAGPPPGVPYGRPAMPPTQQVPSVPEPATYGQPAALRDATAPVDAEALRLKVASEDGLYRSSKPAFAVLYSVLAIIGEALMFRPLMAGLFKIDAKLVMAPLFTMIAFPMLAIGLYALSTGAATAVQFQGPRVWLRVPLAYLPIALLLLVAAGAAA